MCEYWLNVYEGESVDALPSVGVAKALTRSMADEIAALVSQQDMERIYRIRVKPKTLRKIVKSGGE